MKKIILLFIPFFLFFVSCQPEIKEVEKIVEVEKPNEGGYLKIQLFLPHDAENIIQLTNDTAPVKVKISSPDSIKKVVWKKGVKNYGVKPAALLTDNTANIITLDENSEATFSVTENGCYDVVAEDSIGRYEWEQIEVKTIDKTPPSDVTNFSAEYASGYIYLTWNEPAETVESYNSPFKNIKISYVYNNNSNDTDNSTIVIPKGTGSYSIQRAPGKTVITYLDIKVQTLDEVGNASSGVTNQVECFETFTTTPANAKEIISNILYSAKVIVTGQEAGDYYRQAISSRDRLIALDLSGVTGYTSTYYYEPSFGGWTNACTNLTDIVLPPGTQGLNSFSFFNCSNLQSIVFPSSVNIINCGGLEGTTNLTKVVFEDTDIEWKLYYTEPTGYGYNYILIKTINHMSATDFEENVRLLIDDLPNNERWNDYVFCTENSNLWQEINQ